MAELLNSTRAPVPLSVRMLGPLDARVQGEPLPPLRSRKGYWLLALLVLRAGREVRREWLAETLWPDSFGEEAFASLRQSLRDLRQRLGAEAVRIQSPTTRTLRFEPAGAEIDVLAFDTALRRGEPEDLRTAVGLYSGPLLEGCTELWVLPEREAREAAYLGAVEKLAQQALAAGDPSTAARVLEPAVWMAPLRQTLHRTLMQALTELGEFQGAVEVYQELRRRLHHDYNAQPDPDTTRVYHEVRAAGQAHAFQPGDRAGRSGSGLGPRKPAATPDLAELPQRSLPQPLTPLIGREADLERLLALLTPGPRVGGPHDGAAPLPSRLVTLTGPGGVGKTRLAVEAAHLLGERFADGAVFLDLAGVRTSAQLVPAVALALGIREEGHAPLAETVTEALHRRDLLLVMDNCEQVVESCSHLAAALLRACPRLAILATSRERLGITGETVHAVPPLPTAASPTSTPPPPHTATLPHSHTPTPSAALFLQRVAAVLPGFVPGEAERWAAEEICGKLDGLPLALELAAPLAELMPLTELAGCLDRRFDLLAHGDPTAPERHRSLRAVIDWSYDLLTPAEQLLFRRLSVFAGPWTLPAAEAVTGAPTPLAPQLHRLVSKSLVTAVPGAEVSSERRFRLLDTLREYAAARLQEAGEEPSLQRRHLEYAVDQAEAASAALTGPEQLEWLARLDADYDNLRAALHRSLNGNPADAGAALRLSAALARYWQIRGLFSEGYRLLTATLGFAGSFNLQPSTFNACRAEAHGWAGFLATYLGDYPAALRHGESSLAFWRELDHRRGIAAALGTLGIAAKDQGDRTRARALFEESLVLYRAEGDRIGEASMLGYLGIVAAGEDEPEIARAYYAESLRIRRELQDRWGIAASLNNLGLLARQTGDLASARRLLAESLEQRRALGDRRCVAITLNQLGLVSLSEGDSAHARDCFRESLELSHDTGDRRSIAYSLEVIARLLATPAETGIDPGAAGTAVRLYAAAARLRQTLPAPLPPSEVEVQTARLDHLRTRLGAIDYERVWQEGERLCLEEAIRLALFAQ